jgi:hypothetical protein
MPKTAADLAPVLKQAVTQSGLFYEAHQARWVAGDLPTEALRQEPQGKYPVVHMPGAGAEQVAARMGNAPETAGPAAGRDPSAANKAGVRRISNAGSLGNHPARAGEKNGKK